VVSDAGCEAVGWERRGRAVAGACSGAFALGLAAPADDVVARLFFVRFLRGTVASGNGFLRSAVSAWAVTQTGVWSLVRE
jgi:hypothetical protein